MFASTFELVPEESTPFAPVIRDLDKGRSVTNDAEAVVLKLHQAGLLTYHDGCQVATPKRLFYYDSTGTLDELCHDGKGTFTGFRVLQNT